MLYSGTNPESYITEYSLVDKSNLFYKDSLEHASQLLLGELPRRRQVVSSSGSLLLSSLELSDTKVFEP